MRKIFVAFIFVLSVSYQQVLGEGFDDVVHNVVYDFDPHNLDIYYDVVHWFENFDGETYQAPLKAHSIEGVDATEDSVFENLLQYHPIVLFLKYNSVSIALKFLSDMGESSDQQIESDHQLIQFLSHCVTKKFIRTFYPSLKQKLLCLGAPRLADNLPLLIVIHHLAVEKDIVTLNYIMDHVMYRSTPVVNVTDPSLRKKHISDVTGNKLLIKKMSTYVDYSMFENIVLLTKKQIFNLTY